MLLGIFILFFDALCVKKFKDFSLKFSTVVFCVSISFPNAAADKMGCCWVFLYYFSMPYV